MSELLIYGATGYTGALLARAARDRGIRPVLAGRNGDKLRALANDLNLDFRIANLESPERLDEALRGMVVVLNAAGPFSLTSSPLIDACLRGGAHYLDISGEVLTIEAAASRGAEAKKRGLMLMAGVGFDVVPSDCLLSHVTRRISRPKRIFLGVSGLSLLSRGSALTMIDQIADPVWVRRFGKLRQVPHASLERSFDFGSGPSPSLVVSWGDVASAYYSTGVPDVTAYFEATAAVRVHGNLVRAFAGVIPFTPWQAWLKMGADFLPEGPTAAERARRSAVIVAEIEGEDGRVARSRLRSPEAYTLTSRTATEIAGRVLAGDWEPGFQTPSRVFGSDFILSFPEVSREDL